MAQTPWEPMRWRPWALPVHGGACRDTAGSQRTTWAHRRLASAPLGPHERGDRPADPGRDQVCRGARAARRRACEAGQEHRPRPGRVEGEDRRRVNMPRVMAAWPRVMSGDMGDRLAMRSGPGKNRQTPITRLLLMSKNVPIYLTAHRAWH